MPNQGQITIQFSASEVATRDFGDLNWNASVVHTLPFSNGTGANQYDLLFADERTVASGANDDLDIRGSLLTPTGDPFAPVEITAILVINKPISGAAAPNTTNLTVGGGTNVVPGFSTASAPIRPGGFWAMGTGDAAGIATTTAGTADILRISNSAGAAATYQIMIFGRSA